MSNITTTLSDKYCPKCGKKTLYLTDIALDSEGQEIYICKSCNGAFLLGESLGDWLDDVKEELKNK